MRFALVALLLLGALPAVAPAQSKPKPDARERWSALPEAERDRLRKAYEAFRKLPPEERDRLSRHAEEISSERKRLESRLTPEEAEVLKAIGAEGREEWLRKAVFEQLRSRHRGMTSLVPREELDAALKLPADQRPAALRALADKAITAFMRRVLDGAEKRQLLEAGERERILALPREEAAREILAIRKEIVVSDLEKKPELRRDMSDADWSEIKSLAPEPFFERLEARRALRRALEPESASRPLGPKEGLSKLRARVKQALIARGTPEEEAERLTQQAQGRQLFQLLGGGPPPKR